MEDIFALFALFKHSEVCTCMCTCKSNLSSFNDNKGHGICNLQNKLYLRRHYLNNLLKVNLQNKKTCLANSILPLTSRASHDECQMIRWILKGIHLFSHEFSDVAEAITNRHNFSPCSIWYFLWYVCSSPERSIRRGKTIKGNIRHTKVLTV